MDWIAIGVDPGATGAVAFLTQDGEATGLVLDTGDPMQIYTALQQVYDEMVSPNPIRCLVGVEKVSAWPGMGVSGAFRFGGAFVGPRAVCAALGLPVILVTPQKWNALCFESREKPQDKALRKKAVLRAARERWPQADLKLEKHGAIAEALWIALYVAKAEFIGKEG